MELYILLYLLAYIISIMKYLSVFALIDLMFTHYRETLIFIRALSTALLEWHLYCKQCRATCELMYSLTLHLLYVNMKYTVNEKNV